MDDFALRKRQSYGSILIDAQSRKVVDLIPSRKLSDVQEWLQNFPNLTFIIRDGSHTFRSAISEVSPDIIQIADRFHVLKSLTDHAVKALRALIPKKIELGEENKKSTSKQFTFAQNQKQILRSLVREKRTEGWKYAEIARFFQLDYRTVKRYCDPQIDVLEDHQQKDSVSEIDYYVARLQPLLLKHEKLFDVYKVLVEEGYSRAFSTFQKSYKPALTAYKNRRTITKKVFRRPIIKLLFMKTFSLRDLDETTRYVLKSESKILEIIQLVAIFREILSDCSLDALDQWIRGVQRLNNKHLNSFLNGLNRDKDAIQNALIFPELSNGLAEGKINKLKKIKRMMFGRCHFQTLKMKVLLSEK